MLSFEDPIKDIWDKITLLKASSADPKTKDDLARLEKKYESGLSEIYKKLTPWNKVELARHKERPKTQDYIQRLIKDFFPLLGDRSYGNDLAITGGIGIFREHPVMIIGHEKGHDTASRIAHNFGMAHPEGYRKVLRLMGMAERFSLPLITLVDTPGAYAGIGAEERGQSQAIAACIEKSLSLSIPILSVIIGEGGSGGAVALATANRVCMLEHSVYSVISAEGCASILWRTADKKQEAAQALCLTAQKLHALGIIETIIPEPLGGAHRNGCATMDNVGDAINDFLDACIKGGEVNFRQSRRDRFMDIGKVFLKP